MIKVVNERTDGAFEWKEGTLYPVLHRLEGAGLVRGEWQGPEWGRQRKYYRITRTGRALLTKKSAEWASFAESVNVLLFAPLPA
jgi:DNA-binding PadR family transcriptional regulator